MSFGFKRNFCWVKNSRLTIFVCLSLVLYFPFTSLKICSTDIKIAMPLTRILQSFYSCPLAYNISFPFAVYNTLLLILLKTDWDLPLCSFLHLFLMLGIYWASLFCGFIFSSKLKNWAFLKIFFLFLGTIATSTLLIILRFSLKLSHILFMHGSFSF